MNGSHRKLSLAEEEERNRKLLAISAEVGGKAIAIFIKYYFSEQEAHRVRG